ncbi:MAG: MMPL family transporter [Planctomycetes bacterium]|nr:MMPL family transporter [Planctomycetota bacterium]
MRLLIALILTCAALPLLTRLEISSGNEAWVDRTGPAWAAMQVLEQRFGRDEGFVIGFFSPDVLAPDVLAWQAAVVDDLATLPDAGRILALTNAEDVTVDEFGPAPAKLIPTATLDVEQRTRVLTHPLYRDLLVAGDGRAAAIVVDLAHHLDEAGSALMETRIAAVLAAHPPPAGGEVVLGGLPAQKQAINQVVADDQRLTVPLTVALLAVLLLMVLRHPLLVLVPLASLVSAVVWTYALVAVSGQPLDAILGLLPPLVMGIAVATTLHLLYALTRAWERQEPHPLHTAMRSVTMPLVLATLTTIAGVGGLWWGPVEAVRRFAPFGAAGVLFAALSAYLWVWALARWLPQRAGTRLLHGPFGEPLGQRLGNIAAWCARQRVVVLGVYVLLTAISVGALTRITADADFLHALPPDNPVRLAHERIDNDLTGSLPLDLVLDLGRPLTISDLPRLDAQISALRQDPTIAYAIGVNDVVTLVHQRAATAKQPLSDDPLADLRLGAAAVWKRLVGSGADGGLDHSVRLIARQHDGSVATNAAAAQAAMARARAAFPTATVYAASGCLLLDATSQRLVPSVAWSLGLALPAIGVLLLIFLRSWRLALIAIPVAGLPLLFTYAILPPLGWHLDIGVSMIACIALGIIMDDSIHMSAAFSRTTNEEAAAGLVGPVLFNTCLALAGAFLACLFGGFSYTRHFGALLGLAFVLGLVVNLTLAPALVAVFRRRSA